MTEKTVLFFPSGLASSSAYVQAWLLLFCRSYPGLRSRIIILVSVSADALVHRVLLWWFWLFFGAVLPSRLVVSPPAHPCSLSRGCALSSLSHVCLLQGAMFSSSP